VQRVQDLVEQAVRRVVEVREQQQRRGWRQHDRQVHQAAQVPLGVPQLIQQDRGEERHRVAEEQSEDGEFRGVPPGPPERRIVDDAPVVLQAYPGGLWQAGD
jgi:hypothetical protein